MRDNQEIEKCTEIQIFIKNIENELQVLYEHIAHAFIMKTIISGKIGEASCKVLKKQLGVQPGDKLSREFLKIRNASNKFNLQAFVKEIWKLDIDLRAFMLDYPEFNKATHTYKYQDIQPKNAELYPGYSTLIMSDKIFLIELNLKELDRYISFGNLANDFTCRIQNLIAKIREFKELLTSKPKKQKMGE